MSSGVPSDEASVLFKEHGPMRMYLLNRPSKLNVLNRDMLERLRPKIEEWGNSGLVGVIAGTGIGRAFCAGGDVVSVMEDCANPDTLPRALEFFKREFEMDYILAAMPKPYIAVMDGITMGGGVGLSINAPFRIASENTNFAMPETSIGYCPDVGASYFLSRVDGEIGTYLGLTSNTLNGRALYEHGFATHYVPARRLPSLLERISSLENSTPAHIDMLIEEHRDDRAPGELSSPLVGNMRVAIDTAFGHNTVEDIFASLKEFESESEYAEVQEWAKTTLKTLHMRSPTSLKVALRAIRLGKKKTLLEALQMELNIATAFCRGEATKDFQVGVTNVLIDKTRNERPAWNPNTIEEVTDAYISAYFFPELQPNDTTWPRLDPPEWLANARLPNPMTYALPTEEEIGKMVRGAHKSSGSTVLALEELVTKFEEQKKGKAGVREKIVEVVQRKCAEEADKNFPDKKWLKWKH